MSTLGVNVLLRCNIVSAYLNKPGAIPVFFTPVCLSYIQKNEDMWAGWLKKCITKAKLLFHATVFSPHNCSQKAWLFDKKVLGKLANFFKFHIFFVSQSMNGVFFVKKSVVLWHDLGNFCLVFLF